jgi:hypothetical protein
MHRGAAEHVIIGADPLDRAQRPWSEARTRAVGDAEIHGNADHRHLKIAEIRVIGIDRHVGCGQECRNAGIGRQPRAALRENLVRDLAEGRIEELAAMALAIFRLQCVELLFIPSHAPDLRIVRPGLAHDAPQVTTCVVPIRSGAIRFPGFCLCCAY